MSMPLRAALILLTVVCFSSCREDADDATTSPGSCDLLSEAEVAKVKTQVKAVIDASESLAAWQAWWLANESRSFSYAVTQSSSFVWNGTAWDVTTGTETYPVELAFYFPDGAVIHHRDDWDYGRETTLAFADGTMAVTSWSHIGGLNGDEQTFIFEYEGWRDKTSSETDTYRTSETPYGRLSSTYSWDASRSVRTSVYEDVAFTLPGMKLSYVYENDSTSAKLEVVLDGETRRYKGPAAACEAFAAMAPQLFPDIDEILGTDRFWNGIP